MMILTRAEDNMGEVLSCDETQTDRHGAEIHIGFSLTPINGAGGPGVAAEVSRRQLSRTEISNHRNLHRARRDR